MKALLFVAIFFTAAIDANARGCMPNNRELFAPFLQRFSTEPAFALKRTVLPLRVLKWEYGIDENGEDESAPIKSFVSKRDYLRWPTLDSYMKNNNLSSSVDRQTRSAVVLRVFQQDSDWPMLYHFKLWKGCWYFWQYEDQSL